MSAAPTCAICGEACGATDRNSDGTYAHAACLYSTSLRPSGKDEKGGNRYANPSGA